MHLSSELWFTQALFSENKMMFQTSALALKSLLSFYAALGAAE